MDESTVDDRNTDLFFQIADVLDFKPESYDQTTWGQFDLTHEVCGVSLNDPVWFDVEECGTVMCIAGHAAHLAGWHPTMDEHRTMVTWNRLSRTPMQSGGATVSVESVATTELGINPLEAQVLFDGACEWTSDDLRKFGKGESILHHNE